MLSFLETPRFNTEIRYGTAGGPEFKTDVVSVDSGAEKRESNWESTRGTWRVADDLFTRVELDGLIAFFRGRIGKAGGFRFKDWNDWYATLHDGRMVTVPSNTAVLQLAKVYALTGTDVTFRAIHKPVPGKIRLYKDGVLLVNPPIDYTTGLFILPVGHSPYGYTWEGEFDVPARFDVDSLTITFEGYRESDGESLFQVHNLTIVELQQEPPSLNGVVITPIPTALTGAPYIPPARPGVTAVTPVVTPPPSGTPSPTPAPTGDSSVMPFGRSAGLFSAVQWQDEFNGTTLGAGWSRGIWYAANGTQYWSVSGGAFSIWPQAPFDDQSFTTRESKIFNIGSYFEIEAKLPKGACFPSFMLFKDGGVQTELDVMESGFPGAGWFGEVGTDAWTPTDYQGTVLPRSGPQTYVVSGSVRMAGGANPPLPYADLSAGFHKYGFGWSATGVEWFFDGVSLGRLPIDLTTLTQPMWLAIDLWFNVSNRHPGLPVPDASNTPQGVGNSLVVNYVRQWNML